jgi:hypothetical protein
MTAHDQQLGGRGLPEQPDGGVILADYATNHDIGITFAPAGKALGELFFGLCGNAIPRDVDIEVGVVHPRFVDSDQFSPAPRRDASSKAIAVASSEAGDPSSELAMFGLDELDRAKEWAAG